MKSLAISPRRCGGAWYVAKGYKNKKTATVFELFNFDPDNAVHRWLWRYGAHHLAGQIDCLVLCPIGHIVLCATCGKSIVNSCSGHRGPDNRISSTK